MLRTGVIADDFTGATDIASAYGRRGHRAVVVTGPAAVATAAEREPDAAVLVVALKSRTAPVAEAVAASIAALDALLAADCERFVFKYCSTFDSTDDGNIGPVLDALADRLGAARAVVVPAFPDNGRTVRDGVLRVGDQLLEESSMRHHPLTPMTRSNVADLLRPQTTSAVAEVHLDEVRSGSLDAALDAADGRWIVVDAVSDDDLAAIAAATSGDVLVSGSAGIALGVTPGSSDPGRVLDGVTGRRLVVSGSASQRTREQVQHALAAGHPGFRVDPRRAAADPDAVVNEVLDWLDGLHADAVPVVSTVGDLADVDAGVPAAALEAVLAQVVEAAVDRLAVGSVVVAGGETSGAVVRRLGVERLSIGPTIAAGVCWCRAGTASGHTVALALKSGNFGGPDLFTTAWEVAR